jgi:hypothetical protein
MPLDVLEIKDLLLEIIDRTQASLWSACSNEDNPDTKALKMISDITIIDDRAKKIRSLLEENGDTKK